MTLPFRGAWEAADAIRRGLVSSVKLTRHILERIEKFNPALNAIVTLLPEQAMNEARAADMARANGIVLGPLHGVPITIKDVFAVAGARTTAGVPALLHNVATDDATAVARLRAAGAVILGLTNVPYMSAAWVTTNEIFGRTNNPWDLARTPGGSTGGGAAAVSAGLGYLALGSDIAGSIRIPAHFCGLFGHKTSFGVIASTGSFPDIPGSPPPVEDILGVSGLLARSARDLATALRIVGGPDGEQATAFHWSLPSARGAGLSEYRVGYVLDHPMCPVTREVKNLLAMTVEKLRAAGVVLQEGWPEGIDAKAQFHSYATILNTHLNRNLDQLSEDDLRKLLKAAPNSYEAEHARLFLGPTKNYLAALRERSAVRAAWRRYFAARDAFLMPTAFVVAIPHDSAQTNVISTSTGSRAYDDLLFWIAAPTLTGCPATTAPVGLTDAGLPVGIQIMGPRYEDATTIDLAGRISELTDGLRHPPKYL